MTAQTAIAYDYEKQAWTTGAEAREIRKGQLIATLGLLQSAMGEAYAQFIGQPKQVAIENARRELETL